MHLAALIDSSEHVCCRYRIEAIRSLLRTAGHQLDLVPFPTSLWDRFHLVAGLSEYDGAVIQRRLLPDWMLKRLRSNLRHLFFDFDDSVFLRDSFDPRGMHNARSLRRFGAICRAADVVIAGNEFLAEEAIRQGATAVRVIPTCVDPSLYPLAHHERCGQGVRLGWIGSASTLQALKRMAPLLEHMGRNCNGLRLRIICDSFFRLTHMPTEEVHWSSHSEGPDLASADIGIAWLPDDDWSRGKCGLKVLQYMAAGLPVIANPVGVQSTMVRHGETGFLASSSEEWVQAVGILANDPELRRRMGAAGRRRLESHYTVAAAADLWCEVLEETPCLPSLT